MSEPGFFDSFTHLERLLKDFGRSTAAARDLRTPNAEDDELVRCGMIAFAQNVSLDLWNFNHFEYVRALRDEVSGGQFSVGWRRFTCLAAGYFLGMRVAGVIDDADLRLAEAHTPGFMWLHSNAFDAAVDQAGA
ncbi:MAG TPA: hypothetical protein VK968_19420 [Roseimicrobium sp.]|nr:hypothetical protein [Roseimicrobium sp.]